MVILWFFYRQDGPLDVRNLIENCCIYAQNPRSGSEHTQNCTLHTEVVSAKSSSFELAVLKIKKTRLTKSPMSSGWRWTTSALWCLIVKIYKKIFYQCSCQCWRLAETPRSMLFLDRKMSLSTIQMSFLDQASSLIHEIGLFRQCF